MGPRASASTVRRLRRRFPLLRRCGGRCAAPTPVACTRQRRSRRCGRPSPGWRSRRLAALSAIKSRLTTPVAQAPSTRAPSQPLSSTSRGSRRPVHAAVALKVSKAPPVGAFYAWRVRACDASLRCGAWTEVRYLHVGRVREDIDGDSYGDLLALSDRGVEAYLGRSQFDVSAPNVTIAYGGEVRRGSRRGRKRGGYRRSLRTSSLSPSRGRRPKAPLQRRITTWPDRPWQSSPRRRRTVYTDATTSAGDMNGDGFAASSFDGLTASPSSD